jgi:hypothetical protein
MAVSGRERVEAILHEAGFEQVRFDSIEEPVYFGPDAARAFEDVTKLGLVAGLLGDLADRARSEALGRVRATLREHETAQGVLFESSSWLVRAAKLPSRRRAR